jgi:hypothetical protein
LVAQAAATAENSDRHDIAHARRRELVQRHLPPECRERDTWRHVSRQLTEAAKGGDMDDVIVSLRLVLQLERVPCLPQ